MRFVSRLFSLTRFAIFIPIVGSLFASLLALAFGGYEVLITIRALLDGLDQTEIKGLILNLVVSVDLELLGITFYLIALGLYELFIDENITVPDWLVIHDLDTLKAKLLSVIVVVLSVQFLGQALSFSGEVNILAQGLSIAAVILAVAYFLGKKEKRAE